MREIAGKPLIQRVIEQLYLVESLDEILVATDDDRIADFCRKMENVEAVMTSTAHRSGTDRCAEAVREYGEEAIVLNVQGDEPFIEPQALEDLVQMYRDHDWDAGTLVVPLEPDKADDPHIVKAVFDHTKEAMYFSRSVIPHYRDEERGTYYKHMGIYIFRNSVLQELAELPQSDLERAEHLEQLCWMEDGYSVGIHITEHDSLGIDTEAYIKRVEEFISRGKQ